MATLGGYTTTCRNTILAAKKNAPIKWKCEQTWGRYAVVYAVVPSALDHASKSSQNELPADLPVRDSLKQTNKQTLYQKHKFKFLRIFPELKIGQVAYLLSFGSKFWQSSTIVTDASLNAEY